MKTNRGRRRCSGGKQLEPQRVVNYLMEPAFEGIGHPDEVG